MTTIVWFRNDLRTLDHEPLYRAARNGPVVPVYCVDPRQFGSTYTFGFPRTGPFRAQFLWESMVDLQKRLAALGTPLVVRVGVPETVLPTLVQEVHADTIFYHSEMASEEVAVEQALRLAVEPLGVRMEGFWGQTLYHRDELPFPLDRLPNVFSEYRKIIEAQGTIRLPFPTPEHVEGVTVSSDPLPQLEDMGITPLPADPRGTMHFTGGETEALARLDSYVWQEEHISRYKETRNGMVGDSYSTKFSPWLANGSLSPRTVYETVTRYETESTKNESTYWVIYELLWRDYFRFVLLKYGNALFHAGGIRDLELQWKRDSNLFTTWAEGRTGYPLVDAAMHELRATGFVSNRGRQNAASFLTNILGIDWRMGAEWFESWLIDYDVASNYGNWAYSAGVGNDPHQFRFFNVFRQAEMYDPNGVYVKPWLPELAALPADKVHHPSDLSPEEQAAYGVTIGKDYPAYIVPLFESAKANEAAYRAVARAKKKVMRDA